MIMLRVDVPLGQWTRSMYRRQAPGVSRRQCAAKPLAVRSGSRDRYLLLLAAP